MASLTFEEITAEVMLLACVLKATGFLAVEFLNLHLETPVEVSK